MTSVSKLLSSLKEEKEDGKVKKMTIKQKSQNVSLDAFNNLDNFQSNYEYMYENNCLSLNIKNNNIFDKSVSDNSFLMDCANIEPNFKNRKKDKLESNDP